jgi:hypothetical protein
MISDNNSTLKLSSKLTIKTHQQHMPEKKTLIRTFKSTCDVFKQVLLKFLKHVQNPLITATNNPTILTKQSPFSP